MRFFFFLILLAGLGVGVAYPWYARHYSRENLGTYQVFDGAGYREVVVGVDGGDAPVEVLVDLTAATEARFAPHRTVLTLTAAIDGRTMLAEALTFEGSQARLVSPQSPERVYRASAGTLAPSAGENVVFRFGAGDAEDVEPRRVDLVLMGGGIAYDERAQPVGISLIAVGFVGLILAFRRRRDRTPANPNSQPPPPRWGRDRQ